MAKKNDKPMSNRERKLARRAKKIRQQRLKTAAVIAAIALVIGGFIGLGFVLDWWAYQPTATYHASIEVENYGSLHVALYGNDAPETVETFLELAEHGHFDGKSLAMLLDENMIVCDAGEEVRIAGEFKDNGVKNRVSHKLGTLTMLLPDENDPDSANGSFGILVGDAPELDGNRAAFGCIDNTEILDNILKDMRDDGAIPKITSISSHHSH